MPSEVILATNPIVRGYDWSETLTWPAGTLLDGDQVIGDFRAMTNSSPAYGATTTRNGDTVTLSFDKSATADMDESKLVCDLVLVRSVKRYPLIGRLSVQVIDITTKAPA